MQQRTYHGNIAAGAMADYLIRHYSPGQGVIPQSTFWNPQDIQVQQIGNDGSYIVQIGHGKDPTKIHHIVLTLAIASLGGEASGVVVTVGQRTWFTQDEITSAALWGLLAVLITPLALFGLIWPLSEVFSDSTLVNDIWNTIDLYAASMGAQPTEIQPLDHPHLGL